MERFICDSMLGRLAKWLRIFGSDTLYFADIPDREILKLAGETGRVLLTRDTLLMKRRSIQTGGVRAFLVADDDWREQLRLVAAEFDLGSAEPRCPVCNGAPEDISKEEARERVPAYVWETQPRFRLCPDCGRVYWKATQWARIVDERRDIIKRGKETHDR